MVGIPRSKGCTTCRRRKVACDQQRPFCQRCIKIGRQCEGYEHYPIFVNRTQDGLVPRARFEEAKPDLSGEIQGLTRGSHEQGMVQWFADLHASHHGSWIYHAAELPSPSVSLQTSMLALSLTRYGRLHGQNDAVLRGQQAYGEALTHLQRCLYDPDRMWHDETLVCVRAAILYELFESTSDSPIAWHNHLSGITRLIELRGPNRHRTPLTRAVLEDVRYVLMLEALMLRKQSPFGGAEWQMGWLNAEQQLYDLGFRLAEVLEQTDQGVFDTQAYERLYTAFGELKGRLDKPSLLLTSLACELMLGFIAAPLGLPWACNSTDIADGILELLPVVTGSGDEHRSIFPLTCVLWHYRTNEAKYVQAEVLMKFIVNARKVRFAGANYQIKPLIPLVARDE